MMEISFGASDNYPKGSRDGVEVRVLASHQCDSSSIPGVDAICGLS